MTLAQSLTHPAPGVRCPCTQRGHSCTRGLTSPFQVMCDATRIHALQACALVYAGCAVSKTMHSSVRYSRRCICSGLLIPMHAPVAEKKNADACVQLPPPPAQLLGFIPFNTFLFDKQQTVYIDTWKRLWAEAPWNTWLALLDVDEYINTRVSATRTFSTPQASYLFHSSGIDTPVRVDCVALRWVNVSRLGTLCGVGDTFLSRTVFDGARRERTCRQCFKRNEKTTALCRSSSTNSSTA
jgi:hypothetical protein